MARTIQSAYSSANTMMRSNKKNYAKFGNWLNGVDTTDQNLDNFTPFIQGTARIFLHKLPVFMEVMYPTESKNFKTIIETGYTNVQGINDISVDFVDFEGGFNASKWSAVSSARDDSDTLTISVYELTGSPLREYMDTWVTGTRDIRTGVAHYHGAVDATGNSHVEYGEKNHTAEFIYVLLDPTMKRIEYACLFAHCFPANVKKDHLNYEKGNRDGVLMPLEFKMNKYESPAINDIGAWYMMASQINYNYLNFTPDKAGKWNQQSIATAMSEFQYGSSNTVD